MAERTSIENGNAFLVVDLVELSGLAPCPLCSGRAEKRMDDGHTSAVELNRPAGAKGRDDCDVWIECVSCGHKMDTKKWPCPESWEVTIEDSYGNCLVRGIDENKQVAIKEALAARKLEGLYV